MSGCKGAQLCQLSEQLGQNRNPFGNGELSGVETEIVILFLAPLLTGIKSVIDCPVSVDGLDVLSKLSVRRRFPWTGPLPAPPKAALQVPIDKDAKGMGVPQNKVRTSADDDAVGVGGHLHQNFGLLPVHRQVVLWNGAGVE